MKKKITKKLELSKETLRNLGVDLRQVVGGYTADYACSTESCPVVASRQKCLTRPDC